MSTTTSSASEVSRGRRVLTLLAIAAATTLAFAGVGHNEWLRFDDPTYVLENVHI